MDRRKFLIVNGSVAGAAGLGLAASYALSSEESVIVAILRRRLGPLQVEAADLESFSRSYVKFRAGYRRQLRLLGSVAALLRLVTPYPFLNMGSPFRRLEDNVVSNFLLSTDFFEHGADVARPLRYVGMFDPYVQPCRRLFAAPQSG
jgi:hypothetical protein